MPESQQPSPIELKDEEAVEQLKNDPSKLDDAKNDAPTADPDKLTEEAKDILRRIVQDIEEDIRVIRDPMAPLLTRVESAEMFLHDYFNTDGPLDRHAQWTDVLNFNIRPIDVRIRVLETIRAQNLTLDELQHVVDLQRVVNENKRVQHLTEFKSHVTKNVQMILDTRTFPSERLHALLEIMTLFDNEHLAFIAEEQTYSDKQSIIDAMKGVLQEVFAAFNLDTDRLIELAKTQLEYVKSIEESLLNGITLMKNVSDATK